MENPFHFGSPAGGESFVDRDEELAGIVDRMLSGRHVILLSPRRYGKTSLLLEAVGRCKARRGRGGYASLLMCSSQRDVAETLLGAVLNGPLSWLSAQRQKLTQLLTQFRPNLRLELEPTGALAVRLGAGMADRDWRDAIATALRLLGQAGEGKRSVCLVLDEFQRVAEIDEALPAFFKTMADELRDVSLVFAGSKMHVMQRIATGPGAPLLGMGETFSLGLIPEDIMVPFLTRRARSAGKHMPLPVGRLIYEAVDGIPNDVQRLAYDVFAQGGDRLDADEVEAAIKRLVSHRAVDYEESFVRLAPGQQRLLKALARQPRSSLYSRAFMDEIELANSTSVRRALDALEDLEQVAFRSGKWTVADAFYRRWLAGGR